MMYMPSGNVLSIRRTQPKSEQRMASVVMPRMVTVVDMPSGKGLETRTEAATTETERRRAPRRRRRVRGANISL